MPSILNHHDNGYSDEAQDRKLKAHRSTMVVLRQLAKELALAKGTYEVRSNQGGMAVSGEVTLHGERIYVQVGCHLGVLVRSCNGRKDYSGGPNHWFDVGNLEHLPEFAKAIQHIMEERR